jgi:hypothetical protein
MGTEVAAWLLVGLTVSIGFVFALRMKTPLLVALATPSIFVFFKRLRRLAKRQRINAEEKLGNDERNPILYLRTFEKGRVENPKRQDRKTHEERLTSVLEYVGPVVAVGEPGEHLPPIGALRLYFNHSEWEGKVKELMSRCQLIVMQAGHSEGLKLEMLAAKEIESSKGLLFSFVACQDLRKRSRELEYELFKNMFEEVWNCALPEHLDNAYFLYFGPNGQPQMSYLSRWKKYFLRGQANISIQETLRPILKIRGIELKRRFVDWRAVGLVSIFICFVIISLGIPMWWYETS